MLTFKHTHTHIHLYAFYYTDATNHVNRNYFFKFLIFYLNRFSQHVPPEQHASNSLKQQQPQQQLQQNTLGRCILSDKDKMIQPDAFRAAPYDEEYMENQCYERPIENDNCSYELYANSSFIYAEAKYLGLTQKEVCYFVKQSFDFRKNVEIQL